MNKEAFVNHDHDWYDTDEETPMDAMNLKSTRYGWSKDKLNLRKITMKDSSCKKMNFVLQNIQLLLKNIYHWHGLQNFYYFEL